MKKRISKILVVALILFLICPSVSHADDWFEKERGYYTLVDEADEELTIMAREIFADDEYVSGDNKHYLVTKVDKKARVATAKLLGEITLPEIEESDGSISTAQQQKGSILLYATHNSESYEPTDGTESIEGDGGILDVAESFQKNLQAKGIKAVLDKTHHDPHDAGAYRRSRQTAIKLIKDNMPVAAKFDMHRDAVPKKAYATQVDGQDMSKVRIVIGRGNQNRQANQELAYKIKAVADKAYPGLIKDIFFGRGSYNQELSPRSLLFEMGTFENTKEAAQKSSTYLADVVLKAMYGGSVQPKDQDGDQKGTQTKVSPINQDRNQGGNRGILWLVLVVVIGGIGFLFISSGGKEMKSKISNFTRQEFSSFLGRKKKK